MTWTSNVPAKRVSRVRTQPGGCAGTADAISWAQPAQHCQFDSGLIVLSCHGGSHRRTAVCQGGVRSRGTPFGPGGVVHHILVVEDEPNLRVLLERLLTHAGYEVTTASTGATGLQKALQGKHDLVLLDLMLPDLPGEDVLRALVAARPAAKVLVLSSVAEVRRRVNVLDAGAVDFVAKPFVNSDLIARIRLRLRITTAPPGTRPGRMVDDLIELDGDRHELIVGGQRIKLSQREFVLLAHLLQRRGQVCTRQELLADVWGISFDPRTNVVDVYIRRLRAKLMVDAIETVRNVGYRLAAG